MDASWCGAIGEDVAAACYLATLLLMLWDHRRRSQVRRAGLRKADLDRAIKAAKDVGLAVTGLEVQPNGQFRVLTTPSTESQPSSLESPS